jgi:hypothetical protein
MPGAVPITLDTVKRYIGLETNVTFEKRPAWVKRMAENVFVDLTWKMNQAGKPV